MTTVLSIGTTDPWNVAGLGLDIRLGGQLGAHVLTVVTAVSAQDEHGLHALEALSTESVRAQLAAIPMASIQAVRVGALTSPEHVHEVAHALRRLYDVPAVVDPVLGPTNGGTFADDATLDALRAELAALPNVVLTPNLREASALLRGKAIDRDSMADAARAMLRWGARGVLLTGGHLSGNPVDVLASDEHIELFTGTRLDGDMRGTGCTLAMALAVELADGADLRSAVAHARVFVRSKIAASRQVDGLRAAY